MRIFPIGVSKRWFFRLCRVCCSYGAAVAAFLVIILLIFSDVSVWLPVLVASMSLKSIAYLLTGAEKFLRKD